MVGLGIMNLFLDCEWADVLASELVSIALVSQNGQHAYYAERAVLPEPTPWVEVVVYPLLERNNKSMTDMEMTRTLRAFLAGIDAPRIHYDFQADRALCQHVLDGFKVPPVDDPGVIPTGLGWQLLTDTGPALERWWRDHPEAQLRRHHALADAIALRAAWLSLWGI